MKNLFRPLLMVLLTAACMPFLSGQNMPGNWFKYYGDQGDNFSEEAKRYGDGVFVAGRVNIPNPVNGFPVSYGTFSKLNPVTGAIIWQGRFTFNSRIEDFAFVPEDNSFLLVGHVTPFQNDVDNFSFIVKIDENGDVVSNNIYGNTGRESFTRIIRHPDPADVMAPYYVLGRANPVSNTPSFVDVPLLLNVDTGGGVNWRRELEAPGRELETVRGLSVAEDGDLLIVGNDIPENNGVVLKVSQNGEVDEAWAHPGSIDWYDAVPLGDDNTFVVGERFAVEFGAIGLLDEATGAVSNGFQFPAVTEIVRAGALSFPDTNLVAIYFTGRVNDNFLRTNVIGVTFYDPDQERLSAPTFFKPDNTDVQRIEIGRLFADNENKQIVFTDTREAFFDGSTGIGKTDISVGVFSPDFLDANCLEPIDLITRPFAVEAQGIEAEALVGTMEAMLVSNLIEGINYVCLFVCEPVAGCDLSLSATVEPLDNCFESNLIVTPSGGQAPYTVTWDIDCDMNPDITTEELTTPYTFSPAQDYTVCVTITDANGCVDSTMIEGVLDDEAPVITGCPDTLVVLPTDPGQCTATFDANDYITATDNCTEFPTVFTFKRLDRSRQRANNPLVLNWGSSDIGIDVTDEAGNLSQCLLEVLVLDQQAPTCPPQPAIQAVANPCGDPVMVSFPDPMFVDNCPGTLTIMPTSMPTSGDEFPVGITPVTFSGTDAAGNTGNCTVEVSVSQSCGEIVSSALNCRGDNDYQLVVDFDNGLPVPITSCSYSVMINETFVTLTGPVQFVNGMLVVNIFSDELFLEATATVALFSTCPCPEGEPALCTFTFEAPVECCVELSVPDTVICADVTALELPILGLDQLVSPYDVQQVRYYVSDPPPTCTFGGDAFQLTNGYQSLMLAPNFHGGNICVYAEVDLAGGGACLTIRTEIASVQRCDLITGMIPDQQFCYSGTPVSPAPLVLTLSGGDPNVCGADVQWFGPDGNPIVGANDLSYQPGDLSLPAGTMDCDERFTYRAEITSVCGVSSVTSTIRLFNDDAQLGDLSIEAPDIPPLCPGEDVVIRYDPACTGDDMMWQWSERTANTTYTDLTTNGIQNPVYFSNRLYEDTWYLVSKTNGSCPADSLEIFVDINDPLLVTGFTASYNVACQPDFLNLNVSFTSEPGCVDSVFYYRNGMLLTVQSAAAPAYVFDPIDDDISGNYYAVVRDACCNLRVQTETIVVKNPPAIAIGGPCFLCNSDENDLPSTLTALATGAFLEEVNLQWYVDGIPFGPANASTVEVFDDDGDIFTLEMTTANGCVYTASFTPFKRCFVVGFDDLVRVPGKVFPNPTIDYLVIETDQQVRFREITLYDALGRPVKTAARTGLGTQTTISLLGLPKGVYVLQAFTESGALLAREIIKE